MVSVVRIPMYCLQNAPPDPADQYLRAIQEQYVVQVTFRQKQKNFHTTMVVVKGCEWEAARVKEATLLLMEHLCGSGTVPGNVVTLIFHFQTCAANRRDRMDEQFH